MPSALLVVDLQEAILARAHAAAGLVARIAALADAARAAAAPVVYVQHEAPPGTPFARDTPGWMISAGAAPRPSEPVIAKQACDSFNGTTLDATLRDLGVDHLIITGLATQWCVDTATRRAASLGYHVTLVADGHSTADGVLKAVDIIRHHNALFSDFSALGASVRVAPAATIRW